MDEYKIGDEVEIQSSEYFIENFETLNGTRCLISPLDTIITRKSFVYFGQKTIIVDIMVYNNENYYILDCSGNREYWDVHCLVPKTKENKNKKFDISELKISFLNGI